jgi:hypothetical protein
MPASSGRPRNEPTGAPRNPATGGDSATIEPARGGTPSGIATRVDGGTPPSHASHSLPKVCLPPPPPTSTPAQRTEEAAKFAGGDLTPEPPRLGEQPSSPGETVKQFVTDVAAAVVPILAEKALDMAVPGAGKVVKIAFLAADAIDAGIGAARGAGFRYAVPVIHLPDGVTLDVTMRFGGEQASPLPDVGIGAGWDSSMLHVDEPVWVQGPPESRVGAAVVDEARSGPVTMDMLEQYAAERMWAAGLRDEASDGLAFAFLFPRQPPTVPFGVLVPGPRSGLARPLSFTVERVDGQVCEQCGGACPPDDCARKITVV